MFRDTETNYMQLTKAKLEKMASRFLLLDGPHRSVDVPENCA